MSSMQRTCPTCGKHLINIVTGAICLDGHSKIFPKVDIVTNLRGCGMAIPNASVFPLKQSPKAEEAVNADLYTIEGEVGLFLRVKKEDNEKRAATGAEDDDTLALRYFKRAVAAEEAFENAGLRLVAVSEEGNNEESEEPQDSGLEEAMAE